MSEPIYFRLSKNADPEERLEEAALWKAMSDEFGSGILPLREDDDALMDAVTFGRQFMHKMDRSPVSGHLPYWDDPAFLANCRRFFEVHSYEDARGVVAALHSKGKDAFLKSTRPKHAIVTVRRGQSLDEAFDALALSFIDGGPKLMVQELCEVRHEFRFFCIGRKIVSESPIQPKLTPLDFPLPDGTSYETPHDDRPVIVPEIRRALRALAECIASDMLVEHASIDCALINGKAGVVELNPMRLGQLGLYACDVRALARGARAILATPQGER